jgi:hypothetical protein
MITNSKEGLEQASPANAIFLFITEAKTHWKAILKRCLKNWMQKDKDKWPFDRLSWTRINDFSIIYHGKDMDTPWWNDPYNAQVWCRLPWPSK